ncbi:uncharacterized protein LOC144459429 [Epinephelus lanceolatus]
MGMKVLQVPLHKMVLYSDLFQGEITVGVRPALPIGGITLTLGNGVAGGRVWADAPPPPPPVVSSVPLEELKLEQRADPSLEGLFDMVLPEDEVVGGACHTWVDLASPQVYKSWHYSSHLVFSALLRNLSGAAASLRPRFLGAIMLWFS